MKILYVINALTRGGAELGLLHLLERKLFLDNEFDLAVICDGEPELVKKFRNHPDVANVWVINQSDRLSAFAMLKAFGWLVSRLGRYHMAIASLAQANMVTVAAACFRPRLRMVSFFHNTAYSKKIYERIIKWLSPRLNACLYDSKPTYLAVKGKLRCRASCQWIYVPLYVVEEAKAKQVFDSAEHVSVFSVGRLNQQKNYFNALGAIRRVRQAGVPIRFFIAGEGELEQQLRDQIDSYGLGDCVELLGFRENWLDDARAMDMYLLSSSREGLSIATLEAMSCALPIVATPVGGITDYGRHMENMVVCNGSTEQDLFEGIMNLVEDATLRQRLGQQARRDAIVQFGAPAAAREIHKVRAELLAANDPLVVA